MTVNGFQLRLAFKATLQQEEDSPRQFTAAASSPTTEQRAVDECRVLHKLATAFSFDFLLNKRGSQRGWGGSANKYVSWTPKMCGLIKTGAGRKYGWGCVRAAGVSAGI